MTRCRNGISSPYALR